MDRGVAGGRAGRTAVAALAVAMAVPAVRLTAQRATDTSVARPTATAPVNGRTDAPVDLTGYWVSVVTEDWQWRMMTPLKGDYSSVPLNDAGRRVADTWDSSKENACEEYGVGGVMRIPGRLHITWEDDQTLKIETDAGTQTRRLQFDPAARPPSTRTLQGFSKAEWKSGVAADGPCGFEGIGPCTPPAGPPPKPKWLPLKVVTTQARPGWLRRNGVPYSDKALITEHFMRFAAGDQQWFTVTTIVDDPTYLTQPFITSTNFKREPDGAKWHPSTCRGKP
jgi:hypothetical protein